jgi:hypothetical protein
MASYVEFGDAEAAACAVIRADPVVAAFQPQVSTDLIGYTSTRRWVRVARSGGVPTLWMHLDNPVITVDTYAEKKAVAYELAQAVRGALFHASGTYTGHGLILFDVADSTGLAWTPHETTPAHYSFAVVLVTRPDQ